MSDTPPNPGPSHETLANLKAMMPSFIKGLQKGKIGGKGRPALARRPRKVCPVCGLLHDHAMLSPYAELEIKSETCATCGPMLKEGYAALVCGEKYALVKCHALADWAGTIKQVSPHVMEKVEKEFGLSKRRINGSHRETEPPATS